MRHGQTSAVCNGCGCKITVVDSICYGNCLGCAPPEDRKSYIQIIEERRLVNANVTRDPQSARDSARKSTRKSQPNGIEGEDYFIVEF